MVKPDDDKCKLATFKNGYLRLLMTLISFQRVGENDDFTAVWTVPSNVSADQLKQSLDLISKSEYSPPTFDDGREAIDFIRRKSAGLSRRRAVFDDEDDAIDDDEDEEILFPAGGPTAMQKSDALKELKKTHRRRRKEGTEESEGDDLTEDQLRARRDARRQKELEKNRKIKSELFVHSSDEEDDEEKDRAFFMAEEKLRQRSKIAIMKELLGVGEANGKLSATKGRKRKPNAISADIDDEDSLITSTKKRQSSALSLNSDNEATTASERSLTPQRDNILVESEKESTDTPMSSPHTRPSESKTGNSSRKIEPDKQDRYAVAKSASAEMAMSDDEEEEDAVLVARPARQRVRAGFIVDSSDEE